MRNGALLTYAAVLQEPPTVAQGGAAAPAGWPATGTITYEHVTAAYRPGLAPVLSDVSFTIQVSLWNVCWLSQLLAEKCMSCSLTSFTYGVACCKALSRVMHELLIEFTT